MKITITGTPGTGKTTVSNILSQKLGIPVYHLSEIVKEKILYSEYDRKRESFIVDIEKLREFFSNKENFIAEGLVAHFIPSNVLIILRANPETIRKRLKKRNYNKSKIEENVEAEKFAICATDALEEKSSERVLQINTTNRSPEEVVDLIIKGIRGEEIFEDVDWLEDEWNT